MKTFKQGAYARVVWSAAAFVLCFLVFLFAETVLASSLSVGYLAWLACLGAGLAAGAATWLGITLRSRAFAVSVRDDLLVFRNGGKERAVALGEIDSYSVRLLAGGRARYVIRSSDRSFVAVVAQKERAEFEALLPVLGQGGEDVPCIAFPARERLRTLWVRLIAAAFFLTVAVVTLVPPFWAFFSAEAAAFALKVMLIAFGAAAAILAADYGVRELLYRGYAIALTDEGVRVTMRGGAEETRYSRILGVETRENIASMLFGVRRVHILTEEDGNGAGRIATPFLLGLSETELLVTRLAGRPAPASKGKATDLLPLALASLLYVGPVIALSAMFTPAFLTFLLPLGAVLFAHWRAKEISVGDGAIAFSRGYFGRTTVAFRTKAAVGIERAAGLAAQIFGKVNLKISLRGARYLWYTGCFSADVYSEIEEKLRKQVDNGAKIRYNL